MESILEKAREVGRLVARADEYLALKRANERLADDRETVTLLNRLSDLQDRLASTLQAGAEPGEAEQQEYETLVSGLQARANYQALVAAQSNFDRLMLRINEEIARGIEAGEQSRIILPS